MVAEEDLEYPTIQVQPRAGREQLRVRDRPVGRRRRPAEPADPERRGRRRGGRRGAQRPVLLQPARPGGEPRRRRSGRSTGSSPSCGSVLIDAPKGVILSSGSGRFAATVTNQLDQPVTREDPGGRGRAARGRGAGRGASSSEPKSRTTVLLNASSSALGVRNVTLLLTDTDGVPLGSVRQPADPLEPGQQRDLADHRHRRRAAVRRDPGPPVPPDPGGGPLMTERAGDRAGPGSRQQRGDGRRHDRVPDERVRPVRAAGRGARRLAARRRLQHRQHDPEHALHPVGRRHLQRRPGAAAGARDAGRPGRRRRLHQPDHHPGRDVPRGRVRRARRGRALGDAACSCRPTTTTPTWRPSGTRSSRSPASACRRSSSTGCTSWSARSSTPAAGSGR